MRIFILVTAFLVILVLVAIIRKPVTETETWTAMGTFASATVSAGSKQDAVMYIKAVKDTVSEIEAALSVYRPGSDIDRLNNSPTGTLIRLGKHSITCLQASDRFYKLSGRRFDPTVGPLMRLWGFMSKSEPVMPSQDSIEVSKAMCGFTNINITDEGAVLQKKGIKLDLGGIGKGYAVDVCYDKLIAMGARDFLVNLGGNIRCSGSSPSGAKWRIAVRNPFATSDTLGTLTIESGMAVATSGNYERFVNINGTNYSHIIDPLTGRPASGTASVTVICPAAVDTDGLSTSLFIAGPDQAAGILSGIQGSHALFILDSKELTMLGTPGINNIFETDVTLKTLSTNTATNAL